jgi:hypothetical protein
VGLSAMADRMDPEQAAQVCTRAAGSLAQALADEKAPSARLALAVGLSKVADRMDPEQAAQTCCRVVPFLTQEWAKSTYIDSDLTLTLVAVSSVTLPADRLARSTSIVSSIGAFASPALPPASLPLATPALGPLPCRFSTPQLVEMLKHPLCFGPARRVLLDHLAFRYQRPFIDHWDFIRFAQEHDLRDEAGRPLDFISRPGR